MSEESPTHNLRSGFDLDSSLGKSLLEGLDHNSESSSQGSRVLAHHSAKGMSNNIIVSTFD